MSETKQKTQTIHYLNNTRSYLFYHMFSNIFEVKYANKWCNEEKKIHNL